MWKKGAKKVKYFIIPSAVDTFRTGHLVVLVASGWYKIPLKWPVRKVSTAEGIEE
jgi:hypothetical protein